MHTSISLGNTPNRSVWSSAHKNKIFQQSFPKEKTFSMINSYVYHDTFNHSWPHKTPTPSVYDVEGSSPHCTHKGTFSTLIPPPFSDKYTPLPLETHWRIMSSLRSFLLECTLYISNASFIWITGKVGYLLSSCMLKLRYTAMVPFPRNCLSECNATYQDNEINYIAESTYWN